MELFRALAVFAEPPTLESASVARALGLGALPEASEYTEIFVFQLYPYASVYLGAEGMLGGGARDLIAGFWRALSQTPPPEPDHLSVMLALYAELAGHEANEQDDARRESWQRVRRAYLWEHLLSWLPVYLSKLKEIAPPFYLRWGEMLLDALLAEARATQTPEPPLSLHLRDTAAAGLVDPREGETGDFLQTLLSPARSGMILVRSDLTRAARTLELGLRIGERKYVLESLLAQDARGVLGWLAREAANWSERHRRQQHGTLAGVARAWEAKADASARLLEELKAATDGETQTDADG